MKTIRLAVAILVSAAAAPAQEVRQVAFRTLCLESAPGQNDLSLPPADAKGKALPVPLFTAALSPVIEGKFKGDEIVLRAKETGNVFAKGKLAKSKRQVLLVLPAKADQGADVHEIRAFDDDLESFKPGSVRALNLAPEAARFTLAGTALPEIPPDGSVIFPPVKEADEYGMYPVTVEVRKADGAWAKVYSASWKTSERRREIAIVQYQEQFKQWTIKLLSDEVPWLK